MSKRDHFDYDQWPPVDDAGNEFRVDWFEEAELDDSGQLTDDIGRQYRPFTGSLEPIEGRCNVPLTRYEDRYPRIRYCSQKLSWNSDSPFCHVHRPREELMETAQDALKTGLFTKTYDHLYGKLDPYKRLLTHALWSSLMSESVYQFDTTSREETFDFSESDQPVPPEADADGVVSVTAEYPTERVDRGLALWGAACDTLKALTVQPHLMADDDAPAMGQMEATEALPVNEDDGGTYFITYDEVSEHPLNLAYSRLIRDREELLEYGGVTVDDASASNGPDEFVLEVDAADEYSSDDPNFNAEAKSREIVDVANDDTTSYEGTPELVNDDGD